MDDAMKALYELDESLASHPSHAPVKDQYVAAFNGAVTRGARTVPGFEGLWLDDAPPSYADMRQEICIALDHLRAAHALRTGGRLPHGWSVYAPVRTD